MYVVEKDGRKRAICRECRKVHERRDCPKRINWREVARYADAVYEHVKRYQREVSRVG